MVDQPNGELPKVLQILARPAGLLPLGIVLTQAVRRMARRRPTLFERLDEHRHASFLVEPSDLDFAFVLVPDGEQASVRSYSKRALPSADVHVKGPILMLLGLLDGTFDGDALFFNRVLSVSGKTDALVALRNTIEDAELKPSDLLGVTGRGAAFLDSAVLRALASARRVVGAPNMGAMP
ncbi:ubiquinone anaerobic biosynthesis accessory factor UbiT [Consotaella salsifontis]|uniref:Predicted lipid carrier protein YhbT, contains SCP2 domain n=1 Tax=Consotaella salsifontis TaxID=1365950 RepID=A0A1T4RZM1_9HYPH|nr:SCP2 sterol-binding domain-containing protein [Consotaella salsifontis]SKA21402.1 Predicted lipid carrier protein YhbT, contains SCP2 domain [Consotaella salsifontis]